VKVTCYHEERYEPEFHRIARMKAIHSLAEKKYESVQTFLAHV